MSAVTGYGERPAWHVERPRVRPLRALLSWLVSAAALFVAAAIVRAAARAARRQRAGAGPLARAGHTPAGGVLVLFLWEVVLEWTAALRAVRRDVRPRGHRGGSYPLLRAAMCVVVRDLIVFGVLTDMMKGRPAVYATFSSYDEVARHSGLERTDTLGALRTLDQQFGRIARARRYAARPYELVVLSDHGQTQGATFKQRNGYTLEELVQRSLERGSVAGFAGGDEHPVGLGLPAAPLVGAAHVNEVLRGWRARLEAGASPTVPTPTPSEESP